MNPALPVVSDQAPMKPFLLLSSFVHAALFTGLLLLAAGGPGPDFKKEVYRIDFIGPQGGPALSPGPAPAGPAAKAAEPAPKAPEAKAAEAKAPAKAAEKQLAPETADETSIARTKAAKPLPRPSILDAAPAEATEKASEPAAAGNGTEPAAAGGGGGGSGVTADFPNFPYPWYVTQVRTSLWDQWGRRMPRGGSMGCVVLFEIQRDGTLKLAEVETGSGNSLYDYAALASVRGAAPFPPLPPDYREPTLRVHVQFRSAQ